MTPTDPTGFESAQATILAYALKRITALNAALVDDYLNHKWYVFKTSVDAGKIDNTNPPKPPLSYTLTYEEPTPGQGRWATWVQNGPPVCEMPPIPENHLLPPAQPGLMQIGVGHLIAGAWFTALPTDTMPSGFTTPPNTLSQDNISGIYQRYTGFMGAGWYLKIG